MKMTSPGAVGLPLVLLALLSLASCGDAAPFGYQPPPDTTAPSISNLTLSPTSALHNEGGGSINVDIGVDFVDNDGDVDFMGVNVRDSSGSILYTTGVSLARLAGQFSGTVHASVDINTDTRGQFTIRVWLMDETFRSSNDLIADFSVI